MRTIGNMLTRFGRWRLPGKRSLPENRNSSEGVSGWRGALPAERLAHWLAAERAMQIVDLRDAAAFREGHLPGAVHLPLERLAAAPGTLDPRRPTVVY